MYRFKEGELPILTTPNVDTTHLDRLRVVLIGPEGQLFIPQKRVGPDTIDYSCIKLGLDVAIRQRGHIEDGLNRDVDKKIEEILPIPDRNRFNRQKDAILGTNAIERGKFFELLWFYYQTRNYYRIIMEYSVSTAAHLASAPWLESDSHRAYGNGWRTFYDYMHLETEPIVSASSMIKAKPYLETAKNTIQLAQSVPSEEVLGDTTYEVWRDFIKEGRAKELFSKMQTTMAQTLREHADPIYCCPTRPQEVAA